MTDDPQRPATRADVDAALLAAQTLAKGIQHIAATDDATSIRFNSILHLTVLTLLIEQAGVSVDDVFQRLQGAAGTLERTDEKLRKLRGSPRHNAEHLTVMLDSFTRTLTSKYAKRSLSVIDGGKEQSQEDDA